MAEGRKGSGGKRQQGTGGARPSRPRKIGNALSGAERKMRRGEAEVGPKVVERKPEAPPEALDARHTGDARVAWLLDLLAFGRTGRVAERVDLRAQRATMPPVVLAGRPDEPEDPIVAFDDAAAIGRLASRNRAFSQIAARYAPLAMVAKEQGRPLQIELWDVAALVDGAEPVPRLADTADALARYLEASFTLPDAAALRHGIAAARASLSGHAEADRLRARNPLAWMP